ncbi:MAG: FAD-dependent oxidoreductase [Thermoplasmata archaeon]|nr:FAD-dependent oxidoreductase [Thermoplasmata archaeon]
MKIAIVGCGAGGGTAAQFARKTNRKAEIIVYDKERYGQYSKCALPLVIAGKDWKEIIEFPPSWFEKNGIECRHEEVYKIDLEGRVIEGEKEEDFDKVIVATGAEPSCPFEAQNALFLRCLDDAIEIRNKIKKGGQAVIVGAGLIGLEVAEALAKCKMNVKVLEYMPYILPNMLDEDVANYLLKKLPLDVELGCKVEKIEEGKVTADEEYKADLAIVAVGNKAVTPFGKAIEVDEKCMFAEDAFAVGDCTIIRDFFGRKIQVGLGSIAVRQGMVAGINSAGGNETILPSLLPKTTKIFGIEVASVGLLSNEVDGFSSKYIGKDLPHYMDGNDILVKVIANKEGKIVGCQAIGRGASKIIDRVALAIYNGMHVGVISKMENAYAPTVAPVFDAVSIACQMLTKKMEKGRS